MNNDISSPDLIHLPYRLLMQDTYYDKMDLFLRAIKPWLTQDQMTDMFQTSKQNISQHVKAIYDSGELEPAATVKKFLTVRQEGSE
ncbi:MAG: hypothetical protein JRJ69_06770 [Deltaproteobacteria bacterium]|nr:hypothetical protein [Deltaproteobacteria bacterium]MBW2034429.1 hypothetical protein [Deltaproteobacteria bacterium]